MFQQIYKYPRTQHIQGSRLQPGDEDLRAVPFRQIAGRNLVVEEKVDGANSGISFTASGTLRLQSRGHYLTGGARERHFAPMKQWASVHAGALWERLGDRYVLYGEWLYAKHTIFYDALPHFFLEFDVLDTACDMFLATPRRQELLSGLPVVSVKTLHAGTLTSIRALTRLVGPSPFISPDHLQRLTNQCERLGLDPDRVLRETDRTNQMEGLYVKVEDDATVLERYKYVRPQFWTAVLQSENHWLDRPVVPNQLADGVDLFGAT